MIAPIREAEPSPRHAKRTSSEVRRLVASLFLDDAPDDRPSVPSVPGWKAWLLIVWATVVTLIYVAAMVDLI